MVLLKQWLRLGRPIKEELLSQGALSRSEEETDAYQEISNPQDAKLRKPTNSDGYDPNPVVQKDDKKMRRRNRKRI